MDKKANIEKAFETMHRYKTVVNFISTLDYVENKELDRFFNKFKLARKVYFDLKKGE